MNLESLLIELHATRQMLDEVKQVIKDIEVEHQPAYDRRTDLEKQIKAQESNIRELTLQAWVQYGDVPHPGVGVRKMLKYRYLNEDVVQWIVEKLPQQPDLALLLTVTDQFEKQIKAGRLQCEHVYPTYEPSPTISTKLGKILSGEVDDETND